MELNKVYVINLNRRKDRLEHITQECVKHGLEMIRIKAVDGLVKYRNLHKRTAGIFACYDSHYQLLKKLNDFQEDYFFIAEDDAVFAENFKENLSSYINQLPNDWDMIYLGGNIKKGVSVSDFSANFKKALNVFCTHSYIVRKKAIPALIKTISKRKWKVDVLYAEFQKKNQCFITIPELAWQQPSMSDIELRVTNNEHLRNLAK